MEKPKDRRLNSLRDVARMLARVANDLNQDTMKEGKARTLTYVLSILSQVLKDGDIEQRLEKLEEIMNKGDKE